VISGNFKSVVTLNERMYATLRARFPSLRSQCAEAKRENPSPNERFASAEHRIFAKQKAERSAYIQLDAVFSLWHEDSNVRNAK
jgi:hypothetical protein